MERIVIIGATGDQGLAQVEALARMGRHPVAVSRSGARMVVDGQPVESVAADFSVPGSISALLKGADGLFVNLPSTSFQMAEPLIDATRLIAQAARDAGVRRIVFNTSLPVPDRKLGFAAQDARHDMRDILFATGIPTTSIQPVVFLDNLLKRWAWPNIARRRTIVYAHRPELEVSWICHADLAQLMIAAYDRPQLAGRCFPVGGADTVRLPELTAILSKAWGCTLDWESQSIPDFAQRMRKVFEGRASLEAERLIGELTRIYEWYNHSNAKPFRVDMAPVLAELPVTLTPIDQWARAQQLPDPLDGPVADA